MKRPIPIRIGLFFGRSARFVAKNERDSEMSVLAQAKERHSRPHGPEPRRNGLFGSTRRLSCALYRVIAPFPIKPRLAFGGPKLCALVSVPRHVSNQSVYEENTTTATVMVFFLVRVTGFEPAASWSRTKRTTKLCHTRKTTMIILCLVVFGKCFGRIDVLMKRKRQVALAVFCLISILFHVFKGIGD